MPFEEVNAESEFKFSELRDSVGFDVGVAAGVEVDEFEFEFEEVDPELGSRDVIVDTVEAGGPEHPAVLRTEHK